MAGQCRVHLLGEFGVDVDGRPVPPRAWRHSGDDLLKLLALAPAHHLDSADIAGKLWPTLTPDRYLKELHKAVKNVRKALQDDRAITTEGERLRLWPHSELWVDVQAFVVRAKHARSIDLRREALALYRGDLLPYDLDSAWTEPMRTRLRLMHLELLRDPDSAAPEWIDLRSAALLSGA